MPQAQPVVGDVKYVPNIDAGVETRVQLLPKSDVKHMPPPAPPPAHVVPENGTRNESSSQANSSCHALTVLD